MEQSIRKLCICILFLGLSGNAFCLTVKLRTTNIPADQYALFWKDVFYVNMLDFQNNEPVRVTRMRNYVHFEVKTKSNGYFYLARKISNGETAGEYKYDPITPYYYFQSGDDVEIKIKEKNNYQYSLLFKGKGAWKYLLKNKIDSTLFYGEENNTMMDSFNFYKQDPCLYKIREVLKILQWRHSYGTIYYMMKADVLFGSAEERFHHIKEIYDKYFRRDIRLRHSFLSELDKYCASVENTDISQDILLNSPNYVDFLFQKAKIYSYAFADGREDLEKVYRYISSKYSGTIKEKLLTVLFVQPRLPLNIVGAYNPFLTSLKDKVLQGILARVKNRFFSVIVPDYAFTDEKNKPVALSDFKGKIVIVDFWFTGCGACMYQYKNVLAELERRFAADTNFLFISVSADESFSVWEKSLYEGKYTSTHGSLNLCTGRLGFSHPFLKYFGIEYFPTMILLNKNGHVVMFDNADLYDKEKLYSVISNLEKHG